jgi:hypothetical protein
VDANLSPSDNDVIAASSTEDTSTQEMTDSDEEL